MSEPAYLTWGNFCSTVFVRGQKRVHRITDTPLVEIFGDGESNQIGIWIEVSPDTTIPQDLTTLEFIRTRIFKQEGRSLLEVSTPAASLLRQFYHFAEAVAERVLVEKRLATEAVSLELRCFTDLLDEKQILGIERQIGLIGELVFLEHLVKKQGVMALDSWLGPTGEPHDFRLEASEFEVKTTVASKRIHTIHGAEQLVPSKGCALYLISVLLGPPGAASGFSLADKVSHLTALFASDPTRMNQFELDIESCGFRRADSTHYIRQFTLRRPMGLVCVDNTFPAITRPAIQSLLGAQASRVEALQYDINVDGLEHEEGTAQFETVLPS